MTHSQYLFLFFNLLLSPLFFLCTLVNVTFLSCDISLGVVAGQFVEAGQQLAVVEAMKMQVRTCIHIPVLFFRGEFFFKFRKILISPRGAAWEVWIAFFFTDLISFPLLSQNVLRAVKSGVVKNVLCAPGSHLKVDQIIIEFETSEKILSAAI